MDIALERVERERGAPLQRPAALPRMRFKATPGMAQPAVLDMGAGSARQRDTAGSTASNGSPGGQPWMMGTEQLLLCSHLALLQAMRQPWRSLLTSREGSLVTQHFAK